MICAQCQNEVADGSSVCPNCGAQVGVAAPATGSGLPTFAFDAKRWAQSDRIVGGASLVLLISLFLSWFGASAGLFSVTVDGFWHGYMYLVLIICLAIVAYLVMVAGWARLPFKLPVAHAQALLIATAVDFLLTLISFLTKPGGTTYKFGAFIGIIAALVAVVPLGMPAIQARRAK
jgi:hypothetical protein